MTLSRSKVEVHSINIDIFRSILAQWVIIGHLGPQLFSIPIVPGRIAVWGFFIISGYLNAKSFLNRSESGTWFDSAIAYYLSRIKRIYPLLILNALVVSVFLGTLFNNDWYVLFPYMFSSTYQLSNSVLWTLLIEIQLYLLTPILFVFVLKFKAYDWRMLALFCIGIIFFVPLLNVYLTGNSNLIDDRTVAGSIGFYLFGMILSLNNSGLPKLNKNLFFVHTLTLVILGIYFIFKYNFNHQGIQFTIGPLIAILASFLALTSTRPLVNKGHPIFRFLGYYTYEIYVLHGLLVFVFHQLKLQGIWNVLFMWWLMPIFLVLIYDMSNKKKYKFILK